MPCGSELRQHRSMQCPTIGLHIICHSGQIARNAAPARHESAFHVADLSLQHLQVMQSAQLFLNGRERLDARDRSPRGELRSDFEYIAQLLDLNADTMQPLDFIQRSDGLHSPRERGLAGQPSFREAQRNVADRQDPGLCADASNRATQLAWIHAISASPPCRATRLRHVIKMTSNTAHD